MLLWILEIFTNWFAANWTKFAKVIKEIGKQKKEKRIQKKNIWNGPGELFRPRLETGLWPRKPSPEPVRISLPTLTDSRAPRVIPLPQPVITPELRPCSNFSSAFNPGDILPHSSHARAYKKASTSSPLPPFSLFRLRCQARVISRRRSAHPQAFSLK
jgi:hypothetical protein